MSSSSRLIEALPGAEPLTLDEVKAHLRVTQDADDGFIAGLIAAARQGCEGFTGRALIARSCSLYLDAWPAGDCAVLPRAPLLSVTRINVYDEEGDAAEFAADGYYADLPSARVVLKAAVTPPQALRARGGIEIQFRAGYGNAPQDVPAALRQGMKQMIAHLYAHRGDDAGLAPEASGALALFQPYKVFRL